jgi:hypothetical protein|tara:strand:+ start:176 stop:361 length:186 start_codon:yes stop_codon:yes gene_type:complete
MATILKRTAQLADVTVYYTGNRRWTDDRSEALEMTSSEADALMVNADGKNGGWTGVIKETV